MSENTVNAALRALGHDGKTLTWHGFRAMVQAWADYLDKLKSGAEIVQFPASA